MVLGASVKMVEVTRKGSVILEHFCRTLVEAFPYVSLRGDSLLRAGNVLTHYTSY